MTYDLYEHIEQELQEAYDQGYIDGVQDARVAPEDADEYLEYLCSLDYYEGDSGDENDHVRAHWDGTALGS